MTKSIKNRDSFIFYRSFFDAIKNLESEKKIEIYDAIFNYSFDEKEPLLEGVSHAIFTLIKPQLDANRKRFQNGCKEKKKSKNEAKMKQTKSKSEANKNVNVNVNLNPNLNLKSKSEYKLEIIELVKGLQFILEAKLNKKISTTSWKEPIRLLVEKDLSQRPNPIEDVKRAIQEVGNRFGEQYFPVVQSGGALREKFSKIENAMRNNTQKKQNKASSDYLNILEGINE